MAGADVIGAAICIMLLVVVAYVVVGSIMTTSGIVIDAQDDMTLGQQERLGTSISIEEVHWHDNCYDNDNTYMETHFRILNNGNQKIRDLSHIDIMQIRSDGRPYLYTNGTGKDPTMTYFIYGIYMENSYPTPSPEDFNENVWDPGEYLYGNAEIWSSPVYITVVLPNGVTATRGNIIEDTQACGGG